MSGVHCGGFLHRQQLRGWKDPSSTGLATHGNARTSPRTGRLSELEHNQARRVASHAVPDRVTTIYKVAQDASTAAASAVQDLWSRREQLSALPRPSLPSPSSLAEMLPWTSDAEAASDEEPTSTPSREEQEEAARILQSQARASEAIQLLKRRAADGSRPGERKDAYKLGLVIEGGGMRGAVSAGGLQALHDLGMRDCFDAVYGSSAGALNATYFLSSQREGVDIYSQDISNQQFIDLKRLLKREADQGPALNLSFLIEHVMQKVKPLDWQAVVDSPIPLKIVASCLDSLQPILLSDFEDEHDLRQCLRASATVPEVAGPPVCHRSRRLVDAAVFEAIPFRAAIADGCTHVIALATRPPFRKEDVVGKLIDDSVTAVVKRAVMNPSYMRAAWAREKEYNRAFGCTPDELLVQALLPGSHLLPAFAGTHIFPVFPGAAASYSPLCIDAATIMLGVAEGRAAVLNALEMSPLAVPAVPLLPASQPVKEAVKVIAQSRGK